MKPDETTPTTPSDTKIQTEVERPPFDEVMAHLDAHLREHPELRDTLRSNDIVAGIAGQIAQGIAQREQQLREVETREEAANRALSEQLDLAENDPEKFAEQFRTETRARIAHEELKQLAANERKTLATQLGRAFDDLPDGKMTPSQVAQLAQALNGVPDDQIFATYVRVRGDMVAQQRADALTEARLADRLKAEREAWEAEAAAKRAKGTPAPDLRSGSAASKDSDEPDFRVDQKAWDAWYNERHFGRKPVATP
jgi:hypothetical protein